MAQNTVQPSKVRMIDVVVGDIICAKPDSLTGWFAVKEIRRLPSGEMYLTGERGRNAITGAEFDIIGLQLLTATSDPAQLSAV